MHHRLPVTDDEIERIAATAGAHTQTVYRRLLGLPVRTKAGDRVDRVLAAIEAGQSTDTTNEPRSAA